ncbi:MAG: hypothetical protein ACOCYZ_06545 [Halococcoides sp.]
METDRLQRRLDAVLVVSVLNLAVLLSIGLKYAFAETFGMVALGLLVWYALVRR